MDSFLAAVLFGLNCLQFCWFIGYKKFLSFRQSILLTGYIFLQIIISLVSKEPITLALLIPLVLIEFIFIVHYLKNWALAAFFFLLQNTLMILSWLFTWDPVYILWTHHVMSSEQFHILMPLSLVLQQLLFFILILIGNKMSVRYKIFESISQLPKKYILQSTICIILLFSLNIARQIHIIRIDLVAFSYLTLLALTLTGVYSYITYIISKYYQQQHSIYFLSKKTYEETSRLDLANEFKHDYRNILTSLTTYLKKNQVDEALTYLSSIVNYSSPLIETEYYTLVSMISIPPVQGLLINFFEQCQDKKIPVDFSIDRKISDFDITINLLDFIRCLSIILDNALEASMIAKDPLIQVSITGTTERILIEVKNSSDDEIRIEQIHRNKFTTKNNHQGKGLYIFTKLLKQYRQVSYSFKQENNFFSASISLPTNEE